MKWKVITMKLNNFLEQLMKAYNSKTLYVRGGFGAPLNAKNKTRYTTNYAYNQTPKVKESIMNASADTFAFDCVNLIKGVLWGWDANKNLTYGGAKYKANDVPDVSADGMIKLCKDVSTDFKNIKVGEAVWMPGHIGVYIGDGEVIECTAAWENKVIITNITNVCKLDGMHQRKWTKHGIIPWVEYDEATDVVEIPTTPKPAEPKPMYYIVVKGDSLSKIGKAYGIPWKSIAELNGIKFPYIIRVGQKIRLK